MYSYILQSMLHSREMSLSLSSQHQVPGQALDRPSIRVLSTLWGPRSRKTGDGWSIYGRLLTPLRLKSIVFRLISVDLFESTQGQCSPSDPFSLFMVVILGFVDNCMSQRVAFLGSCVNWCMTCHSKACEAFQIPILNLAVHPSQSGTNGMVIALSCDSVALRTCSWQSYRRKESDRLEAVVSGCVRASTILKLCA